MLVVAGGFPGEWEGEHPYDTVQRLGAEGVFFVGWRDHDELADMLNCSDVFAAPAVDEPFGLVYLEAMATGIPPIATNTGGPRSFVNVDADASHRVARAARRRRSDGDRRSAKPCRIDAMRVERGRRSRAVRSRALFVGLVGRRSFAQLYDEVIDAPTGSKRSEPSDRRSVLASRIGVA